jgi:hypothetical protein
MERPGRDALRGVRTRAGVAARSLDPIVLLVEVGFKLLSEKTNCIPNKSVAHDLADFGDALDPGTLGGVELTCREVQVGEVCDRGDSGVGFERAVVV